MTSWRSPLSIRHLPSLSYWESTCYCWFLFSGFLKHTCSSKIHPLCGHTHGRKLNFFPRLSRWFHTHIHIGSIKWTQWVYRERVGKRGREYEHMNLNRAGLEGLGKGLEGRFDQSSMYACTKFSMKKKSTTSSIPLNQHLGELDKLSKCFRYSHNTYKFQAITALSTA